MRAWANKRTKRKEDLCFPVKAARPKLSKKYAEVKPTTGHLLILAYFLDRFGRLQSNRKWDDAMYINPEDETSYTTE